MQASNRIAVCHELIELVRPKLGASEPRAAPAGMVTRGRGLNSIQRYDGLSELQDELEVVF